ncbi:MAG: PQQ-binding-like beta-propeller repeat protein, partial [Bacteroidetes bacterium]|nr:PQQ-binding-like beta-propeller repeat protein [Bacteroidota bacterium]
MKPRTYNNLFFYLIIICFAFSKKIAQAQPTSSTPPIEAALSTFQKFRASQSNSGLQLLKGNFTSTTPTIKWQYNMTGNDGGGEGHVAIGNVVPGVSGNEVVASNERYLPPAFTVSVGGTFCLNGSTGALIWSFAKGAQSVPVIADADNNGSMEVVVQDDGFVYCLNGSTGAQMWSAAIPPGFEAVTPSPTVADLIPGGSNEIIVNSALQVFCLNGATGAIIWSHTCTNVTSYFLSSSPAVGDVNMDGQLDVIIVEPGEAAGVNCGTCPAVNAKATALRGNNGSVIWTNNNLPPIYNIQMQSPVITDINQDCTMEVLFPANDAPANTLY